MIAVIRRIKYAKFFILMISLVIINMQTVQAHDRSESFSKWLWQDNATLSVSLSVLAREATPLVSNSRAISQQQLSQALIKHFVESVTINSAVSSTDNQEVCSLVTQPQPVNAQSGYLRLEANFQCPENTNVIDLNITLFQKVAKNHVHYATVSLPRYSEQTEYFFSRNVSNQRVAFSPQSQQEKSVTLKQVIFDHISLGIEHISFGFDHLLFLLGIMLVARTMTELAWLVTGFTLGHSISLAFAVLGYVSPDTLLVEAFIAFSIFILACEVMLKHNNRFALLSLVILLPILIALVKVLAGEQLVFSLGLVFMAIFSYSYLSLSHRQEKMSYQLKALLTSLFGIVHGFGFASSFLAMGYSGEQLFWKLISFNIGVELGQVFILLLCVILFGLFRKAFKENYVKQLANVMVMTLASMSMFWFLIRVV